MVRPRNQQPTPAELEVLQILWNRGPSTVREVMNILNQRKKRAYTSVMSLLNVMAEKHLLNRESSGRAFMYSPRTGRDKTLGKLISDLLGRAFEGSTSKLVAHLLEEAEPTVQELDKIRGIIKAYERDQGGA